MGRPSKNRLGDSHTFGGGVSTREQVPLEDVKETTTTTKRPSKNHLGDSHTFGGGGSISEQLRFEDVTKQPPRQPPQENLPLQRTDSAKQLTHGAVSKAN